MLQRPEPSEYAPYYQPYLDHVPEGDILSILAQQCEETLAFLGSLTEEQAEHRYAPGKWTVREVVGHIIDTERVFGYRALCISRGEEQPLPGFDQEAYVRHARAGRRPMASFLEEMRLLRASNLALFESFDDEMLLRRGTASGRALSVRAVPFIIAGHELHHLHLIRGRYL